jgi:hypothetical protein
VPTDIYFAGGNVHLHVDEDPGQVAEAFGSANGLPLRLTGGGGEVYVNPATVAFWSAADPRPEPDGPPQPPPPGRGAVTDLWGNPIRKKPRN